MRGPTADSRAFRGTVQKRRFRSPRSAAARSACSGSEGRCRWRTAVLAGADRSQHRIVRRQLLLSRGRRRCRDIRRFHFAGKPSEQTLWAERPMNDYRLPAGLWHGFVPHDADAVWQTLKTSQRMKRIISVSRIDIPLSPNTTIRKPTSDKVTAHVAQISGGEQRMSLSVTDVSAGDAVRINSSFSRAAGKSVETAIQL